MKKVRSVQQSVVPREYTGKNFNQWAMYIQMQIKELTKGNFNNNKKIYVENGYFNTDNN